MAESVGQVSDEQRAARAAAGLVAERVPGHVAIIMDGNGRWAADRGFPRAFGHRSGAASVREVLNVALELGIGVVTLYSFSTENWSRPDDEVQALMRLCISYCDGEREALASKGVRVRMIGDRAGLPGDVLASIEGLERATAECDGPVLCLAINYGSRQEITRAVRAIAAEVEAGGLAADSVDEAAIVSRLDTAGLPDPDLLIRTGGDVRVSNYLLWQISYAEIYVTPTLWPDFGREALIEAIKDFGGRSRRFGGLGSDEDGPVAGGADEEAAGECGCGGDGEVVC